MPSGKLTTKSLMGSKAGFIFYKWKGNKSLLFERPVKEIICRSEKTAMSSIKTAQKYLDKGYYLAGYISYEFGHFLEKKTGKPHKTRLPLLYLGVFKKPVVTAASLTASGSYTASRAVPCAGRKEYGRAFNKIKSLIRNGEVYQANLCFKLKFRFKGDPRALFAGMLQRQAADYPAFGFDGKRHILSASPELFFGLKGRDIRMVPMKGTVIKSARCKMASAKLITKVKREMHNEKNKAENLMIVDLIRNDLGKICRTESVKAGPLFSIKEYGTLYQMTSTVTGKLKKNTGLRDMLAALFPSGSVTGAPKIRAMQVIRQAEKEARGIYTGAIGFIGPRMREAMFNIPIRTVLIEKNGRAEMGVGSGVVSDSQAAREYDECSGKANFLFPSLQGHQLIETMLLENGRYFLLDFHMQRLKRSAAHFGVSIDMGSVLKKLYAQRRKKGAYKVRLLISESGKMMIEHAKIKVFDMTPARIAVSKVIMDPGDDLLKHKTTRRELYDSEYQKYLKKGFDDVIFLNEKGQVTEAHSSNIFIRKNGRYYTPPVSCGLLPGTYREYFMEKNRATASEKILRLEDVIRADEVFLCNSVRGLRPAELTLP